MKQHFFTTRAKWFYGLSAAVVLCGMVLCLFDYGELGTGAAIAGIGFGIGVVGANGHLSTRQKKQK